MEKGLSKCPKLSSTADLIGLLRGMTEITSWRVWLCSSVVRSSRSETTDDTKLLATPLHSNLATIQAHISAVSLLEKVTLFSMRATWGSLSPTNKEPNWLFTFWDGSSQDGKSKAGQASTTWQLFKCFRKPEYEQNCRLQPLCAHNNLNFKEG